MKKVYIIIPLILYVILLSSFVSADLNTNLSHSIALEESSGNYTDGVGGADSFAVDVANRTGNDCINNECPCFVRASGHKIDFTYEDGFPVGTQSWTILMWVKLSAIISTQHFFAMGNTGIGDGIDFSIPDAPTEGIFQLQSGDLPHGAIGTLVMSINKWYMVTATYDSSTNNMSLYVNGTLDVNKTIIYNLATGTVVLGTTHGGTIGLEGCLDEVAIWNRSLKADEVADIYDNLRFYPNFAVTISTPADPTFINPTPADNAFNNTNQTINISHPSGTAINYYLYVNDETYIFNETQEGTNYKSFATNFSDGVYEYKASVQNITSGLFSSNISRTLTIDTVTPTITIGSNNNFSIDNSTIINNFISNLSIDISFFDTNLFQTLINITNESNASSYSKLNTSITGTTVNVSEIVNMNTWSIGNYTVKLTTTDEHTAQEIKQYGVLKGFNYLRYITEEGNIIKIESKTIPLTFSTTKQKDRYNFNFNYLFQKSTYKFRITSDNKISYIQNSKHAGHFVIIGSNGRGNWIDFNPIKKKDIIITKFDDYTYEVEITSKGMKKFVFSSLGGLNTVEVNYLLRLGAVIDVWVFDDLTGQSLTATATIGGHSANTIANTSGARLYNITQEITQLTLNASGYGSETKTIAINSNYHNLSFNMTPVRAVKFYFYDEKSNTLINGETFSIFLETTGFSNDYSTTTNPYTITQLTTGLYELKVSTANYPERQYFDLNITNVTTTNLDIYLINSTDGGEKTFIVKDSNSDNLEDVRINFTRVINGSRITIAEEDTDYAGQAKLYLDSNYEYRIIFTKSGYNTLTINLEPSDSTYTIFLDDDTTTIPPLIESYLIRTIKYNLTYTNSTKTVLFEWNAPNNYSDELCLDVLDLNSTFYSNCSTLTSSATSYTITADNTTLLGKAYAKRNSRTYVIETKSINLLKAAVQLGKDVLIIDLVMFLTLGFIGLFNPIAAVIMGTAGLIGMYLMGMLPIGLPTIMGLIFVVIIISIGIKRAKT